MNERKNAEEWMLEHALQQAVTKLAPARKRKVALLVEAFETVLPLPITECETHFKYSSTGFAHGRIQASNANGSPPQQDSCNMYQGNWVYDSSYPLYNSSACPFIPNEFNCLKYGRPDHLYLKYRWQPTNYQLPRFDAEQLLKTLKGKNLMFIGDSINVDEEKTGKVLKLISIRHGDLWKNFDVLIFNTWHWWHRRGQKQQWQYVEVDGKISKDIERMTAFRMALTTWAKWVDSDVDANRTQVIFQGISPSHYNGAGWNEPGVRNCSRQMTPFMGPVHQTGLTRAVDVVNDVISSIKKPVYLLDITALSQLRKDAHPGSYNPFNGMDCTHWCVAGLPDTWNLLLYTALIK
ncbi:putative Tetratricopeptide repeat (TPR)-like superfamily protein [Hibiscus syriacus]|uniref:Tetratricopeptide repeat (TPR)-like superfamily protein n=1 Tax=Hibiscus syriacus TaxID=106335 RepID=A0A6A2X362_HIBSY|nr:putative Tetratricopeptide repeat (TPR)-like superfamily protein [Hibiscus syriacus]